MILLRIRQRRAGAKDPFAARVLFFNGLLGFAAVWALALPAAGMETAPPAQQDSCVECHAVMPEPLNLPVEAMEHDIHAQKGLSCVDCHGGDAGVMDETSMSPDRGFRGVPERADIPAFCGRCHADEAYMRRFNLRLSTDQLQQYRISTHGQLLQMGDQKVATCVSCHGAHGVLSRDQARSPVFPANVPATCGRCHSNPVYMAGYGIPTDQKEEYERSIHGELFLVDRDFSAPTCNDCHGSHGAFPPGVSSIVEVCGQCHINAAALFTKSPHRRSFDRLGLPQCVTCHGNHAIRGADDEMVGGRDGTTCRRCHRPGSAGYAAAVQMRDAIDNLKAVMAETEAVLAKASAMGMEVSEEQYAYREEVPPRLIRVRTMTHLAGAGPVLDEVQEGIAAADASEASAKARVAEAWARRRNLLIPLTFIGVLMVLMYAKLRQLEARGKRRR